jgi:uncharacterized protein YukE
MASTGTNVNVTLKKEELQDVINDIDSIKTECNNCFTDVDNELGILIDATSGELKNAYEDSRSNFKTAYDDYVTALGKLVKAVQTALDKTTEVDTNAATRYRSSFSVK